VELESREQTDGPPRHALGRDSEGVMCGHLVVGTPVEAATDPHEAPVVDETGEVLPGYALVFHLLRAEDATLIGEVEKSVLTRSSHESNS